VNDTGAARDRVLLLNITKCLTKNFAAVECSVKMPDRRGFGWVATRLKLRALRLEDDREALSQRADEALGAYPFAPQAISC
jgi:hypothetical protein